MTGEPLENETEPDLGAHTFNAGTWESEQAELRFQGQSGVPEFPVSCSYMVRLSLVLISVPELSLSWLSTVCSGILVAWLSKEGRKEITRGCRCLPPHPLPDCPSSRSAMSPEEKEEDSRDQLMVLVAHLAFPSALQFLAFLWRLCLWGTCSSWGHLRLPD